MRVNAEVRAAKNGRAIVGYAARFGRLSQDLGGFRELLTKGCFGRALTGSPDVMCLVDHDPSRMVGRTSSGTCRLKQTDKGLLFRCDLPDTQAGRDIYELVKRGDYSQCSFSFDCDGDDWSDEKDKEGKSFILRKVTSIRRLYDVSPVLSPAYRSTKVRVTDDDSLMLDDDELLDDGQLDEDEYEDELEDEGK